jgi:uncharacterized membrane protein
MRYSLRTLLILSAILPPLIGLVPATLSFYWLRSEWLTFIAVMIILNGLAWGSLVGIVLAMDGLAWIVFRPRKPKR